MLTDQMSSKTDDFESENDNFSVKKLSLNLKELACYKIDVFLFLISRLSFIYDSCLLVD